MSGQKIGRSILAALAFALVGPNGVTHAATQIEGVRYGKHDDYLRIVVDSAAPLTFKLAEKSHPFTVYLQDTAGTPMDIALSDTYLPLHHLTLEATEEGHNKLTVTATAQFQPRFMQLKKDERGLYRLVIDLYEGADLEHLSVGQEGLHTDRVRVQFGDSLSADN